MKIEKLSCRDFRNLKNVVFTPQDGINVIYGENAQGKTNLIEAVWLLTGAKSFRGSKDCELKAFNSPAAVLEADFENGGVEYNTKIIIEARRRAFLNEKPLKSASELAGNFFAVVFSPVDLGIVKNGPKERRRFLDTAIGLLYPNYIRFLKAYTRAVTQRNALLKDICRGGSSISNPLLSAFETEISLNGEKIKDYRIKYLELIEPFLNEIYSGLTSGREKLDIKYLNSVNNGSLAEILLNSRHSDMQSGITSAGPHRDDIEFFINGINARSFASQGQMRSIALSLKLSEAHVIKKMSGEFPVALLDDVMSELDPLRQEYILNHITGWQVMITCCEPDVVGRLRKGAGFHIENGGIIG